MPRKLALRRCQLELILLQWPVFDGIALRITERDKPATSFGPTHHRNRTVIKLSRDIGHHCILTGGEHAYPRDQYDTWMRIGCSVCLAIDRYGRIRIKVLLYVCFQVMLIPLHI